MGYTTEFTGSVKLSRHLTLAEAKELLDLYDYEAMKKASGIESYMQWVPTENLDAIVWNGGEKFYEYIPLLEWLCGKWLQEHGIAANGALFWRGESANDIGRITVADNVVTAHVLDECVQDGGKPLTKRRLGELALEAILQKSEG
jgi:hypothetical protein